MKRSSCECPICKEFKTLPSYYGHLIEKHTLQELSKYMSDFEKNSKFEMVDIGKLKLNRFDLR